MEIRRYNPEDYEKVVCLLENCKVDPPKDQGELRGPCIVADDGDIVGIIFALTGLSSKAYIDYFAVREDHRGSLLAYNLFTGMDKWLIDLGVKRYLFHIEKNNGSFLETLYKRREKYKIKMLDDLFYFSREIA